MRVSVCCFYFISSGNMYHKESLKTVFSQTSVVFCLIFSISERRINRMLFGLTRGIYVA